MPINAASRSIHVPDKIAEGHSVQFHVYSRLAVTDIAELNQHLNEHLRYMKSLSEKGILPISGPFFTLEGKNTGNGFYVLKVDNIAEAKHITSEDPLHKSGVRTPTILPWLQVLS